MKDLCGFGISLAALALVSCGGGTSFYPSPNAAAPAHSTVGRSIGAEPPAVEKVLYLFKGQPDAAAPYGGLLAGPHDEFFGISNGGGTVGPNGLVNGTVYEVSSTGQETVLYSFQGGNDGAASEGGLVADNMGNMFGTTQVGGAGPCSTFGGGCGTVFEITRSPSGYGERVLHAFQGGTDGAVPLTRLTMNADGVLYGTTTFGGAGACSSPSGVTGCGTVFSLTPSGSTYTENIVYSFKGGKDGESPRARLMLDSKGALYGTTEFGGNSNSACSASPSGTTTCGTVFKITRAGKHSVVYRFNGGVADGANPRAALLRTTRGRLVGLTVFGGAAKLGCGTAYELTPSGTKYAERVIYFFCQASSDGLRPFDADGLTSDVHGNLYGTTLGSTVSPCGCGAVFELSPTASGYSEKVLHFFTAGGTDGASPFSSVTLKNGVLYGTTYQGGSYCYGTSFSCGTVYKVDI